MYKKSSFKYWFNHWCAFQMTALNLGCWKFRFLFHDGLKPIMRLFMSYDKLRKYHRMLCSHHPECIFKKDYLAMVVDWECGRFTKADAPMNARQTMERNYPEVKNELEPILNKLNL